MPKIKTKTNSKKDIAPAVAISEKSEKNIIALKSDLHYYKGVAIMALVLFFCVFIAFSSLFCAMYLEVRATQVMINNAVNELIIARDDETILKTNQEQPQYLFAAWPGFEKFGVNVFLPVEWGKRVDDSRQVMHFYLDGRNRSSESIENGDLRIFIKNGNDYEKQIGEDISLDGRPAIRYDFKKNNNDYVAVVASMSGNYAELLFRTVRNGEILIPEEIVQAVLTKFKFLK